MVGPAEMRCSRDGAEKAFGAHHMIGKAIAPLVPVTGKAEYSPGSLPRVQ
jgi:hypothetical protein